MALPKPQRPLTEQEYLEIERAAEFRSEFFQGEMFAMAGGTPMHSLIAANTIGELRRALGKGRCLVFDSNLRVKVEASGLYTYPDVTVLCGERRFAETDPATLTNPTLLVEVLSESTEGYDRGKKSEMYRRIPSLQVYLLIGQTEPRVELFNRVSDGIWELREAASLAAELELPGLGARISLAEIYAGVEFPQIPLRPLPGGAS